MKNGFTLVELLAVIIILSVLTLITVLSVGPILNNSKKGLTNVQINNVVEAAKSYHLKEGMTEADFELDNSRSCININELISMGYIDKKEIKNAETDEKMEGSVKIIYTSNNYSYEYQEKSCTNYDNGIICERVESTLEGNVPEGNFVAGDAYNCKVDPNREPYKFYILTTSDENSDTVNLIMDQNINSDGTPAGITQTEKNGDNVYNLLAWNLNGSNTDGPITSMTFLYNATKDWTNIQPLNYTYKDREYQNISTDNTTIGYTSFESTNGVLTITPLSGTIITIGTSEYPLRARMPIYSGVFNSDYTGKEVEKGEVLDKTDGNEYLYDNLRNNKVGPYGYWMLSSFAVDSGYSWYATFQGYLSGGAVYSATGCGIRPVISMYKFQME